MNKIIVGVVCMILFSSTLWGQSTDIDEVHLLDETSYRGKVIEQKPGSYIRLLVLDTRDTMTFTMDEIDKLVRVPVPDQMSDEEQPMISDKTKSVDYNRNEFALLLYGVIGGGDVSFQGLGVGVNYRLNRRLALGLSTRYLGESGSGQERPYQWQKIPVQLEATYELQSHFNHRSAIYVRAGIGRSFTLNGDFTDPDSGESQRVTNGWSVNPGLGYRFNLAKNTGILLEVSYSLISDRILDQQNLLVSERNWSNVMFTGSIFF